MEHLHAATEPELSLHVSALTIYQPIHRPVEGKRETIHTTYRVAYHDFPVIKKWLLLL